jgi:PAS domain S-box-containing protein
VFLTVFLGFTLLFFLGYSLIDDQSGITPRQILLLSYLVVSALLIVFFLYINQRQKLFKRGIRAEKANLQALFESTKNVIGLFDERKNLVEYNQAFAKYLKLTDNIDLEPGMNVFSQMSSKAYVEKFKSFLDRALQGEKFRETLEYPGPDGALHFLFTYNPIYQNNEIRGVSMFVEDITELKQSQLKLEELNRNLTKLVEERTLELKEKNEELEKGYKYLKDTQQKLMQADKMASLGTLASGVGHEINNPLNFIKNGTLALKNKLHESKIYIYDVETYFQFIEEGVSRITAIVQGLSHFSKKTDSKSDTCDLEKIINNCLVILTSRLRRKNIEVKKTIADALPRISGSEGKLHQALMNILSNAEQAMEKDGKINISAFTTQDAVVIELADTGHGISKENIDRIGDPFFTTKPPGVGTGLGLFITYSIIEEHNGTIKVESEINNGTTFTIEFPKLMENAE